MRVDFYGVDIKASEALDILNNGGDFVVCEKCGVEVYLEKDHVGRFKKCPVCKNKRDNEKVVEDYKSKKQKGHKEDLAASKTGRGTWVCPLCKGPKDLSASICKECRDHGYGRYNYILPDELAPEAIALRVTKLKGLALRELVFYQGGSPGQGKRPGQRR